MEPRGGVEASGARARRYRGDKLATEVVMNTIRTSAIVVSDLEHVFRRHGLTGPGYNVLLILADAGAPLSPGRIGELRLVSRGTVTALLDTLEGEGFVRRVENPADGRSLLVELSAKGRAAFERATKELAPAEARMTAVLSAREKATLVDLLGRIQTHLRPSEGRPPKRKAK